MKERRYIVKHGLIAGRKRSYVWASSIQTAKRNAFWLVPRGEEYTVDEDKNNMLFIIRFILSLLALPLALIVFTIWALVFIALSCYQFVLKNGITRIDILP